MRISRFLRSSFFLALGCSVTGFGARADEELPAIHTLPCASVCANSSRAMGVTQPLPPWPREFIQSADTYVEGYVRLHYKINLDGHVSDVSVVSTVGPKAFADKSVDTVKDWVYKPATLDGKPVETCHTLVVTFKMRGWSKGGRPEIVKAYREAFASAKDEKWDEAQAVLTDALSQSKLNLYERGMLANLGSFIALKKDDFLEAHRLSVEALAFSGSELPNTVGKSLLETRIKSALLLNDMVDALDAADWLKRFDPANPVAKLAGDVQAKVDSAPVLMISAKIPEVQQGQSTYFGLYRRSFSFQDVKGALDSFTLNCKQQAIESKITTTAEWHVPKSWSDCRVLVRGAPGTTFKLAQLTD